MLLKLLPPAPVGRGIAGGPAVAEARGGDDGSEGKRGRGQWLDHLLGGRHTLAYLRDLARGNAVPRLHFPEAIDTARPPVLLIHGFLGTRGSMIVLERRLIADGATVFSFNLGLLNLRDIRASAILIQQKVEAIRAQVRVDKVDIVGHSMGGLIGLYYVKRLGGAGDVRKLVMMGTPVWGTWSAVMGVATVGLLSPSSWQILPGSRFLADLRRGGLPTGVDVYTIAAERDWVCPPGATVLPGATRVTVPLGHSSLVISDEVYRCVRQALGA
jgi:triacylglycerol lipase